MHGDLHPRLNIEAYSALMSDADAEADDELAPEAMSRDEALRIESSGWDTDLDEVQNPS
jgi:hypothetical protein